MTFQKIDKTKTAQEIVLYNTKYIDLHGKFTIRNNTITKIEIFATNEKPNNIYALKSAQLCCNVIQNDTVYYLLINFKKVGNSGQSVNVTIDTNPTKNNPNCNLKIDTGTLIFTDIHLYKNDDNEIETCNIDIFDFELNPDHKNGNILVGNP